jgi:MinD-like ATPase involved in chromosome partitioning or flagellar assembly
MEPKTVRKLEKELHKAIADVICRLGLKKLPLLPSHRTMEMMAKAATAVYETAVEEHERRDG